jgi:hypothetical protein
MIVFTPRPQRSGHVLPQPTGVFEDDALLLLLAARSRSMELGGSCPSGPMDTDDLAFEEARAMDCKSWDL